MNKTEIMEIKQDIKKLMKEYPTHIGKYKYACGVAIAGLEDILEDDIKGYKRIFNE